MKSFIPANAKRIPLRPLAFGEATGHNHRLISTSEVAVEDACEMYEFEQDGKMETALRVTAEGIALLHAKDAVSTETAEHHIQTLVPADYRVVIQEESSDWGMKRVVD